MAESDFRASFVTSGLERGDVEEEACVRHVPRRSEVKVRQDGGSAVVNV